MTARFLLPLLCAAVLAVTTAPTCGAPVFVRDWTIDTPLGRFGYAEIDYTLMIQVGPGPRKLHKVVFLGPLGETPPVIGFGAVSVLGFGVFLLALRFRKQKQEDD